jgi:oligopeptide/dipeptide ABC transporter ATP-binding protein
MYLGRFVEVGPTQQVLRRPQHPYTKALLSAALSVVPGAFLPHFPLRGDPQAPTARHVGCPLVGRCPIAVAECAERPVALRETTAGHRVACLRAGEDLHVDGAGTKPVQPQRSSIPVVVSGGADA